MVQTKCEIYSRVVGYIRPVEQWNEGKQAEFQDRKLFNKPGFAPKVIKLND
jgi:ribonucleoside-triphosphate reductase (formate)